MRRLQSETETRLLKGVGSRGDDTQVVTARCLGLLFSLFLRLIEAIFEAIWAAALKYESSKIEIKEQV